MLRFASAAKACGSAKAVALTLLHSRRLSTRSCDIALNWRMPVHAAGSMMIDRSVLKQDKELRLSKEFAEPINLTNGIAGALRNTELP